jgi:hypothetical protein
VHSPSESERRAADGRGEETAVAIDMRIRQQREEPHIKEGAKRLSDEIDSHFRCEVEGSFFTDSLREVF